MSIMTTSYVVDEFRKAMLQIIAPPAEIKADTGKIERFHVEGDKPSSKNGWYILHTDFPPVGIFGCYKRNIRQVFRPAIHVNLISGRIRQDERLQQITLQTNRAREKHDSIQLWYASPPATNNCRYLLNKRVKAHGLRYHQGAALVPVMDMEGAIHGFQKLWPERKGFTPGTDKNGHFYIIGKPDRVILIAEGYATAATLFEATGFAALVAFDAGNLLPVAVNIRAMFPDACIVLCADNDQWGDDNPGLTVATAAAEAVGGLLAVPYFPITTTDPTDCNDLLILEGPEEIRDQIVAVLGGCHV